MPYADPERQRRYQREAIRRRRAAQRGETVRPGDEAISPATRDATLAIVSIPPAVAPVPLIEEAAPVYDARDLATAGRVLGHMQTRGEPDAVYRARLREVWLAVMRVVT